MKVIHIKSQESVALPIYNSALSHLYQPEEEKQTKTPKKKKVSLGFCTFTLRNIWVIPFNKHRDPI